MTTENLKSPYPFFGGKSRVAPIIWSAFGDVSNYIEPFAGSLAVLLANPKVPKIETVNDKNCYISNFWRAISKDPEAVANFADYPVSEIDLHARHKWLIKTVTDSFKMNMEEDPDFYDAQVAGWWVWGMGASIGNNWLNSKGLKATPLLSIAGGGIHGLKYSIVDEFKKLYQRTKRVRVCCGDWSRVVTPSITFNNNGLGSKDITAVFLDPPYDLSKRDPVYLEDSNLFNSVCDWAIYNGDNPKLRIILCGYEGNYKMPDTWQTYHWNTNGGMGNLGNDRGKSNRNLERIWMSPHCLKLS